MRLLSLKLFLLFIYLLFSSIASADQIPDIKNLKIHKDPKKVTNIVFRNSEDLMVSLEDFDNKLVIINFWATWCAPCRKEMPSLDKLKSAKNFENVKIIPINIADESYDKSKSFFDDLGIKNLEIFIGSGSEIANKLKIRGLPTTILIDKNGYEFARIVGYIDFENKPFLNWLKNNL